MLKALNEMAWSLRFFYVLLLVSTVVNFVAAVGPGIKGVWRFHFAYTSTVCGTYLFYLVLRLTSVLDMADYALAVRWLIPCMAFPFIMPVAIIRWERRFLQKAVEKRVDDLCKSPTGL